MTLKVFGQTIQKNIVCTLKWQRKFFYQYTANYLTYLKTFCCCMPVIFQEADKSQSKIMTGDIATLTDTWLNYARWTSLFSYRHHQLLQLTALSNPGSRSYVEDVEALAERYLQLKQNAGSWFWRRWNQTQTAMQARNKRDTWFEIAAVKTRKR